MDPLAVTTPRQVLVVDDIAVNRKLLRAVLEGQRYGVIEAGDGVEALAALGRHPVDAVISDILMPNMDGYRLCHEIRGDKRWRHLPFIFYSSTYRSPTDAKLAHDLGADRFITKPASASTIADALAEVFASGVSRVPAELTVHGELGLMKQYSARLVSKLEEQNTELYHRTQALEYEVKEREQIEKALRESEQLRRLIVETEPECVKVVAPDGRLTEMNRAGLAMLEVESLADVGEESLLNFVVPEHRAAFGALHRRVMGGESGVLEFEVIGRAGTRRWLETHAVPLRENGGRVTALLGVTRDVTERRRADAALRQSEHQLRLFVEHSPAAIAMLDRDMRYLVASRRWLGDYRLADECVIGRSHYEVFPDVPERWKEVHRRCLAGAVEKREAEEFPRADGSTDWVRWEIRPWHMAGGAIGGLIIFSEVITERIQALEALRDREERTRLALDAAGAGTWELDLATGRTTFDERLRQLFSLPPGIHSVANAEILNALHPDDRARTEAVLREAIVDHKDYDIEQRIVRPDGTSRWTAVKGRAEYDRSGRAVRVRGVTVDVTERKQVEAAARAGEARIRNLFEQASDGIYIFSADSRFVEANPRGVEMLGHDRDELLRMGAADVLAPHELPRVAGESARMMSGIPHLAEWEFKRKDGSRFPAEVSARRLDEHTFLAIVRDLSERRRAEAALHEAEARLRLAVTAANVGPWDWDLVTKEVFFSREWKDQLGYEEHELPNRFEEWQNRLHPDDVAATLARVQRFIEDPAADYAVEFRLRHKDGSYHWIFTQARILRDEAGKPARMLGVHVDITHIKQAQQALAQTVEQLESAQERAHVGSWELDLASGTGHWSREMFRLFRRDPARGMPSPAEFLELVADEDRESIRRLPENIAADGRPVSFEYRTNPAHGPARCLHLIAQGLPDAGGRVRHLAGTVLDITERKTAELELQRAAERTQGLARRLVETREAEQRWLSGELHDRVGQNLTAIGLNLDIVAGALPPEIAEKFEARLHDSRVLVDSVMAAVRGLIAELRPAALDDYGLLAGLRWFSEQIRGRTHLQLDIRGEEPAPRLEPQVEGAMFRIAQEALNNTVKHAEASRASVELGCRAGAWVLTIMDDGVGFDAAHPARPGANPHWGLEMMRERAEAVGARLHVESSKGNGTRIEIQIGRPA